jgi:hypothetical protein
MTVVSILLFFWDRRFSGSEVKKLRAIGLQVKKNGYKEIKNIKKSLQDLTNFSDYISNINPFFEEKVLPALTRLGNGERLDPLEVAKLQQSVIKNNNDFIKQFGL